MPVAPTIDITASWPVKMEMRELSERSDSMILRLGDVGRVEVLPGRLMAVMDKSGDNRRPRRMIWPRLPPPPMITMFCRIWNILICIEPISS